MIRFILRKINGLYHRVWDNRLNLWKTLLFNFMALPFSTAIKLPFLIYGKCTIRCPGKVEFACKPYRGIVKIGLTDPARTLQARTYLAVNGKLTVHGYNLIMRGTRCYVSQCGHLELGNQNRIANNGSIICIDHIKFGNRGNFGNNVSFMDSDIHYLINTETGEVHTNHKPIIIGDNCWVAGNCFVKKGTVLPNGTIVAGPFSMTDRDYTEKIPEYSIIGGSPAKLLKSGMRRVKREESESMLVKHFRTTNEVFVYKGDIDEFCRPPMDGRY